jgi:REP element-mobilizing transposase RayT
VTDNPGMTIPREVVPGRDYMITRRCSERRFFLRPDDATNNAFIYCLALAAQRSKVEVNFSVAMANHHHTGIHDPHGNFPIFTEHFHGLLARCQNAHLGRFENFWSSEPTSVVRLLEPVDVLDKMVYAYANPAVADLVETADEWPGVTTYSATLSAIELTATRPAHFFRDDGSMPETVTLKIHRPRAFFDLGQEEWAERIRELVQAKESEARQVRIRDGKKVLGVQGILAQDPFASPKSHAPHFKLSPKLAAKNKWARLEALRRNRGFLEKYRDAIRRHLDGIANVLFPFGTYWMSRFGKAACEPPDMLSVVDGGAALPAPA